MKTKGTILVINASPHTPSKTERFCSEFENRLKLPFKRIKVSALDLPPSDGTYSRKTSPEIRELRKQVLACKGMFIATPTYWFNIPAHLKSFIEQLTPIDSELWNSESRLLGLAIHAPEGGEIGVFGAMVAPMNMMGFSLVGSGFAYFRNSSDRWVWGQIRSMAEAFNKLVR